ncbi:hypothetical protein [Mosqueiro virus]|uniref:Uncharacterized protein n=1 Tax=Mosqueiro virus TaxID=200403 RepID=A0A0D3R246_9RHAB|nr:hypothetical protein [Mosqueiro virus]AJR28525.1 hypothetical protein [Mosqueiro virus]
MDTWRHHCPHLVRWSKLISWIKLSVFMMDGNMMIWESLIRLIIKFVCIHLQWKILSPLWSTGFLLMSATGII